MVIIRGRVGTGRIHELVKRFIIDEKSATLITDSVTLHDIIDIINRLKKQGYDINQDTHKNIKTMQFTNYNEHYHRIIEDIGGVTTESLYLDIRMPNKIRSHIGSYYKCLEGVNSLSITVSEQLPENSDVSGLQVTHA